MRLPDFLATRRGRLFAFFMLYVTEGIPLGFVATAVATQLRRLGVGPAEIGSFVAAFYLPWAFKWAAGPFVDVIRSRRWGHRRGWILFTQLVMSLAILALIPVPLPSHLPLFTALVVIHTSFGAIQDVAIDSLACNTLAEDERGLANGLMFGGAAFGQAIGGSGVLFLTSYFGFQPSYVFVAASIAAVTFFVALPMREKTEPLPASREADATPVRTALREMRAFAAQSFRAFVGTRAAFLGVAYALLPAGAMSLGLALQSNLSVELGMTDDQVGALNLWSAVVAGITTVLGGWLSDKLGRRSTLAVFTTCMSAPVLWLMWQLHRAGYVMPRAPGSPPDAALQHVLWIAVMAYNVFQGLMYGINSAIIMDITNPRVAATQFTAYMALMNLAISVAASWLGVVIEAWGYPVTLAVDALTGPLGALLVLPWLKRRANEGYSDDRAPSRAKLCARVLAACCLSWLLLWPNRELLGKGLEIANTFYTLVFVASGLFMLAGREVLGPAAGWWRRPALWVAPLLFAMHARHWLADLTPWPVLHGLGSALTYAVPLAGGCLLLALGGCDWRSAASDPADAGTTPAHVPEPQPA